MTATGRGMPGRFARSFSCCLSLPEHLTLLCALLVDLFLTTRRVPARDRMTPGPAPRITFTNERRARRYSFTRISVLGQTASRLSLPVLVVVVLLGL
jgi:hypothetical protein